MTTLDDRPTESLRDKGVGPDGWSVSIVLVGSFTVLNPNGTKFNPPTTDERIKDFQKSSPL